MIRIMILMTFIALLYAFISIVHKISIEFDEPIQLVITFAMICIAFVGLLKTQSNNN